MTDETTVLRERIDGWLDGLPQPAAQPFVQRAIASGERIRRRRRQGTALAVAAAVAAIGVGGALLRTDLTGPAPAPSPGGPGPSTSPTASTTVRYPDGTVTWPGPGAGGTWVVPGVGKLARTELGQVLRGEILTAAPGTVLLGGGPTSDVVSGVGVAESGVAGRVTDLRVAVNDVDGPRLGLLTVRMTRGGLSAEPLAGVLDPCGTWPAGSRGPGLLDGERSAYFESFPQRTCALHRSGGSTFVRWEGHGQEPDGGRSYSSRIVFTVRPDGTAVYVSSSTRTRVSPADGPDLLRPRDWADLERLAADLPVPTGLGRVPDRPADCRVTDLEARLGEVTTVAGAVRVEIRLRNVGVDPCWLGGLPTFAAAVGTGVEQPLGFRGDAANAYSGTVTGPGVLQPGADGAVWLTGTAPQSCPAGQRLPRYDRLEVILSADGTIEMPFPQRLTGTCPGASSRMGPLP